MSCIVLSAIEKRTKSAVWNGPCLLHVWNDTDVVALVYLM